MEKAFTIYLEQLKGLKEVVEHFHKCFCNDTNKRMKHKNTHLMKELKKEIDKYEKSSNERKLNKDN